MKYALTGYLANACGKRGNSGFPDIEAATQTSELPGNRTILQSICHAITLFTREMSDLEKCPCRRHGYLHPRGAAYARERTATGHSLDTPSRRLYAGKQIDPQNATTRAWLSYRGDNGLNRTRSRQGRQAEESIIASQETTTKPEMPRWLLKGLRYGTLCLLVSSIAVSAQAAGNATIRFAMTEAPPLATASPDTSTGMKGLYPDILDEILTKRMGLHWTGTFAPWKRAQLEVQTGTADLFITVPSEERKEYAIPSARPVFEEYLYVYTYKDHPKIRDIRKIKTADDIRRLGLIPVTNIGNHWHQENIDAHGINTQHVPAEESLAKFLAAKRADIMIETPLTMDPKIASSGLTQQIERTPARFGPIGFHLLVGKKSPLSESMNAVDQAIEQFIRDGTRERLAAKHLGTYAGQRNKGGSPAEGK